MNKFTSCDRYKIGFFALLVLVVGMFGYIISSASTNITYKNRASTNTLNESPSGQGQETPGNPGIGAEPDFSKRVMIPAIITALTTVDHVNYVITFTQGSVQPLGMDVGEKKTPLLSAPVEGGANKPGMPIGQLGPTDEPEPSTRICDYTYDIITEAKTKTLQKFPDTSITGTPTVPPTGKKTVGPVTDSDVTATRVGQSSLEPMSIDEFLAGYGTHTYSIEYGIIVAGTPTATPSLTSSPQKSCRITGITQFGLIPSPTVTP